MVHVGIDFGTTNTAVAIADDAGVRLVFLERTVLYFEPDGKLSIGTRAIARYVETEGEGRLVQSIKSHLASAQFTRTSIFGRTWLLEDMIAAYLRQLRAAAGVELGRRCVVGRPVRYWGAETADDDARALERMRAALAKAGFDEVVFEYEPVGAAARFADSSETIVVADFGGGTTDFSVMRGRDVLATGGIGISGDAFDARVIDAVVAPALGRGTLYRADEFGSDTPVPAWLYGHLRRWHLLSFLKEPSTQRLLARVAQGARDPVRVGRLVQLVGDELGLALHRAVEGAKVRLSAADADRVAFGELDLSLPVTRAGFDQWIEDDLAAIDRVLDDVLHRAGVREVDRVFATGGSSLVPAVRARLAARFGEAKLHGGEELTSVAWGLAALARQG